MLNLKNQPAPKLRLAGKKVTVMGLGLYEDGSGISAVKFLLQEGSRITVTDLKTKEQLKDQIIIAKLINESIKPDEYSVSDAEVNAFMEAHKADYESLDNNMLALIKQRIKSQMIEKKKNYEN